MQIFGQAKCKEEESAAINNLAINCIV